MNESMPIISSVVSQMTGFFFSILHVPCRGKKVSREKILQDVVKSGNIKFYFSNKNLGGL